MRSTHTEREMKQKEHNKNRDNREEVLSYTYALFTNCPDEEYSVKKAPRTLVVTESF